MNHLPECPKAIIEPTLYYCGIPLSKSDSVCICDALRACEQRVTSEALQQAKAREANGITWAQAYAAALRDAGQAIPHAAFCLAHGMSNANDLDCDCGRTDAVAAIRALEGEQ